MALFGGMERFRQEVGAELGRLGTQDAMELASALFKGDAFVPYGPGQYTPTPEQTAHAPDRQVEQQQEMDGLER